MSVNDPIGDLLTRIRNAHARRRTEVRAPAAKAKVAVLTVLRDEGYIAGFEQQLDASGKPELVVQLKYHGGKPAIRTLSRVSKPGLRIYKPADDLPRVMGGLGIGIVSTSQGLMTDRAARSAGVGGEVLCVVT